MKAMKVFYYISFCLIFSIGSAEIPPTNDQVANSFSIIDVVHKNVEEMQWKEDDVKCRHEILRTLKNARNSTLFATWVLDSIQLPTGVLYGSKYQLGNYDECLKAPWLVTYPELSTKYCLADVQLSNVDLTPADEDTNPNGATEMYINSLTKHARKLNTITWGVCVPSKCSPEAVTTFLKVLLRSSTLGSTFLNPHVQVDDCLIAGETSQGGQGVKVFFYLILTLLLIAIISTWFLAENKSKDSDGFGMKVAKSFCMKSNAQELVKEAREDIPAMHGIRVLTAALIAFTHQLFFVNSGAIANGLDVDKDLDTGFFLVHTDLFTDTFLMMSGLLLAKGLVMKEKLENPISVLWKRYIRLIGPMALLVFYMAAVSFHSGSGPIWSRLAGQEQRMCAKNWWLSLLMLNNYIKTEEMCFITLWYIPTDYQLTILGVAVIYTWRRHRHAGMVTVTAVTILAVMLPAIGTYWWRLPATIIYNIETVINIRQNVNFNSTYVKAHYRIGSYLVGLSMGTLMAIYKPNQHRNIISKRQSILIFTVFFLIAWIPMSLGGVFYTREYSPLESAAFAATNRIVWVMCLCVLIGLCEYGDLPLVNGLLSWKAWVPLSRLSYGLYLIHPVITLYNVFSARSPMRNHLFTMLSDCFGPIVLGYLFSLVTWLLVQAPISNLTSYLSQKQAQDQLQEVPKKALPSNFNGFHNTTLNNGTNGYKIKSC